MRKDRWLDPLLLVAAVVSLLAALIWPLSYALSEPLTQEEQQLLSACQTGEIIRIHVIASSNSPEDQAIKYQIRDAVIDAFGKMMVDSATCDEMFALLSEQQPAFEQVAQERARALGFGGPVTVQVGVMELPPKTYGSVTLPRGEYRAIRITLGQGKGENWWCVLFPQLCLALSDDGDVRPDVMWESKRIFAHWLAFAN